MAQVTERQVQADHPADLREETRGARTRPLDVQWSRSAAAEEFPEMEGNSRTMELQDKEDKDRMVEQQLHGTWVAVREASNGQVQQPVAGEEQEDAFQGQKVDAAREHSSPGSRMRPVPQLVATWPID